MCFAVGSPGHLWRRGVSGDMVGPWQHLLRDSRGAGRVFRTPEDTDKGTSIRQMFGLPALLSGLKGKPAGR